MKVFCDFDGTIARNDVGDEFFGTFGGETVGTIVKDLLDGRITPRQCAEKEFAALGDVRESDLAAFVARQEIDPSFAGFVEFCETNAIECRILSDGFDFYIGGILKRFGLERIPFLSNRLLWTADPATGALRFAPEYPYSDAECDRCANCKRNHMLTLSGDDDIIVYIGDGISDQCPVGYADVVFAKGRLIKYCQERNITYHRFTAFRDVTERLGEMTGRKRMKKRREAEMARRDVFMQG